MFLKTLSHIYFIISLHKRKKAFWETLEQSNYKLKIWKYDKNHGFYISRIFSKSPHGIISIRIALVSLDSILQGAAFRFWAYFQKQDFFSGDMCRSSGYDPIIDLALQIYNSKCDLGSFLSIISQIRLIMDGTRFFLL